MSISRRSFIGSVILAGVAPPVLRHEWMMPVVPFERVTRTTEAGVLLEECIFKYPIFLCNGDSLYVDHKGQWISAGAVTRTQHVRGARIRDGVVVGLIEVAPEHG